MAEVEFGIYTLRIHIERHVHNVQISGTFTIAEQTAFNTVGTGKQSELARCNTFAAVVMVMKTDYHVITPGNMSAEIFDLIGKYIRCCSFYRRRQIQNDFVF